jgi:hypothetical protein
MTDPQGLDPPDSPAAERTLPELELENVMLADVGEIIAARSKALILHHGRDLDAAGHEVEAAVRRVLRRRLPSRYYIGNGHVVDATWRQSAEFDVVLSDGASAPILFAAADGTEYFPYESVYAVGEVKSGYYPSHDPVRKFVDDVHELRTQLTREVTSPTYAGAGLNLGPGLTLDEDRPLRNPIYRFMVFVDSTHLGHEQLADVYASSATEDLPNLIAFLDRGILARAWVSDADGDHSPGVEGWQFAPEFHLGEGPAAWTLMGFAPSHEARTYAFLYASLMHHMATCILKPPQMLTYMTRLLTWAEGQAIVPIDRPVGSE